MSFKVNTLATCIVRNEPESKEKWPTIFACRPVLGDIVVAASGVELSITAIKHAETVENREGELWQVPKLTLVLG